MDFSGRVAVVTGSARRLGRDIALALARSRADVVVHYNQSAEAASETTREIRTLGVRARALQADLTDPAQITELFGDIESAFGRIDILVNNAATFERRPVLEITADEWDRVMDVNLRAAFLCSQQAARLMSGAPGSIVNIADVSAFQPWPGYAHHSVSKAGLIMLTRVLARALAPEIRVNAVAPGPVLPPADSTPDERRRLAAGTALKRIGTPSDVAETVLFLCASDYVTGETVAVDGGKTLISG